MLASLVSACTLGAFLEPPLYIRASAPARTRGVHLQTMDYDAATYNPEVSGMGLQGHQGSSDRPEGAHGTGYKFMPLVTVGKDSAPAIICLAGAYPGLTGAQLQSPQPLPFAAPGSWNYHMLTGGAAPGGFVAVPGSDLLDTHPDTVGIVCMSKALGLEFPDGAEHEVLALIDRSDSAVLDVSSYEAGAFYALADPQDAVVIRWMAELPAGWRVLGRLLYTQMPFVKRSGASSGFAENSDDFEF